MCKRTKEELIEASEHLHYEITMFIDTVHIYFNNLHKNATISNVLIESINMRIRIFVHFLYPENKHKDDILAKDFFNNTKDWKK